MLAIFSSCIFKAILKTFVFIAFEEGIAKISFSSFSYCSFSITAAGKGFFSSLKAAADAVYIMLYFLCYSFSFIVPTSELTSEIS